jgi:hypothetical protein
VVQAFVARDFPVAGVSDQPGDGHDRDGERGRKPENAGPAHDRTRRQAKQRLFMLTLVLHRLVVTDESRDRRDCRDNEQLCHWLPPGDLLPGVSAGPPRNLDRPAARS